MTVNNSEIIGKMLIFRKHDFYFVQVLKRKKDNPDLPRNMVEIRNFYIESMDQYEKLLPQIQSLCNFENARAYIRLNKRNYKDLGTHMLKRVATVAFGDDCNSLKNTFNSVAGEFHSDLDKKWLIDIDNCDFNGEPPMSDIIGLVDVLQIQAKRTPMAEILPTKNGCHIITRPFNLKLFKDHFPKIDVHKDDCTLLYCP